MTFPLTEKSQSSWWAGTGTGGSAAQITAARAALTDDTAVQPLPGNLFWWLQKWDACPDGLAWAQSLPGEIASDFAAAWDTCPNGAWLLWAAVKAGVGNAPIVYALASCAREIVLPFLPMDGPFAPGRSLATDALTAACQVIGPPTPGTLAGRMDLAAKAYYTARFWADRESGTGIERMPRFWAAWSCAHVCDYARHLTEHPCATPMGCCTDIRLACEWAAALPLYSDPETGRMIEPGDAELVPVKAAAAAACLATMADIVRQRIPYSAVQEALNQTLRKMQGGGS